MIFKEKKDGSPSMHMIMFVGVGSPWKFSLPVYLEIVISFKLSFSWNIWRFSNQLCFCFNNNNNNRNQRLRVKYVALPIIVFLWYKCPKFNLGPTWQKPSVCSANTTLLHTLIYGSTHSTTQYHSRGFPPADWHYLHRHGRKKYCHYNIPCLRVQFKLSDSTTGK